MKKMSSDRRALLAAKTTGTQILVHIAPMKPSFHPQLTEQTDSDASETSSIASDDDLASETLYDRIVALQDILPPSQRRFVASTVSSTTAWVKSGFSLAGKGLWVFSTSALLIGIPWAMAYQEEVQMIEMEKEMRMQQAASEVSFSSFLIKTLNSQES
jgi:import receptor subunit TOM22